MPFHPYVYLDIIKRTGPLFTFYALICGKVPLQNIYMTINNLIIEVATRTWKLKQQHSRTWSIYLLSSCKDPIKSKVLSHFSSTWTAVLFSQKYFLSKWFAWRAATEMGILPSWCIIVSALHNNGSLTVADLIKLEWANACVTKIKPSLINQNHYHSW